MHRFLAPLFRLMKFHQPRGFFAKEPNSPVNQQKEGIKKMNNTKNKNNVRNASNANSARKITITDPASKATDSQRRAIGHAIKNGSWKRFSAEDWKNLTKGRASEIIDQIRAKEGDPLASWGQKKRFLELVREGFLRGVKRETFKNLRNEQIKRMIYKGMKNKEAGTFAGPYLHPDDPTPAAA